MKRSKFVALVLVFVLSVSGLQPIFAETQPSNEVSESKADSDASKIDKLAAGVAVAAGVAILIKTLSTPEKPKVEEKKSFWSSLFSDSEENKKEEKSSWWPF